MMRLEVVDRGHAPDEAAVLQAWRDNTGREPSGVVKTLMPDLDASERAALKRSAEILKEAAEGVRF